MRTIVHLSDLHFGRLDPRMVAPLVAAVDAVGPDLVAVSGDLTQRARRGQFADAHAFLAALRFPRLVVPGNHDVPLYDIATRFLRPLARYRRFIANDVEPIFADEEIIAIGLNSARSLTFGRGRLNELQIDTPHGGRVRVALDGEILHMNTPLRYRVRPLALNVIVPDRNA